ncbi:MAG: peptide transporter [Armatimonadetes bacterium]|nr:peptide transporter [Armatimonadota bacterium]
MEKTDKSQEEFEQEATVASAPGQERTAKGSAVGLEAEAHLDALPEVTKFEEGFSWNTLIGALFVGVLMMPAAIYLGLVTGSSAIGSSAEWVTIILFTYVAQRSYTRLRKQEIYILFYVAGALASGGQLAGGPFAGLIWNQYFVQSTAAQAFGIADKIPSWVVPAPGSPALVQRTFMHPDWLVPIGLLLLGAILGRAMGIGMGYTMFRLTADIERLPFPLAPVAAAGATALGEAAAEKESWRWNVFSIGTMIGLIFGFFYVGIPTVTSSAFNKAIQLIPIPFIDFTKNTEHLFPGAQIAIGSDIVSVMIGFVLPFWLIVGEFISSMISQLLVAPWLARNGYLPHWHPGMNVLQTGVAVSIDFWMSVGIGSALVVAFIGLASVAKSASEAGKRRRGEASTSLAPKTPPPGRGDWPIPLSVGLWAFGTFCYIALCHYLVPDFPIGILIFFGLVWTPLNSYISARMFGITGRGVAFPYLREASFVLSGYKGVAIWFAPIPLGDYGGSAQYWRSVELTGTKFTSVVKAEILLVPIILGFSFVFWAYFWHMGEIPSALYPYANRMWPINAIYSALWPTATLTPESNWLLKAIRFDIIAGASGIGLLLYGIVSLLKLPQMLFYGLVTGMGASTIGSLPMFIGAMLGRFYFQKRFPGRWGAYTPVLLAGYSCGVGLVGMLGVALGMIAKSTSFLPY